MRETYEKFARSALLATLPLVAVVACKESPKNSVSPTFTHPQTSTASLKPTETVANLASLLSPERQIFLKEARAKSMGVIFINIADFDPIQSVFIDIKELNPQTGTIINKVTKQLYDPNSGQKSSLIETGILIKNCNGTFQVGISIDGRDFSALGFSDPQTGEIKSTFTIDSQECFKGLNIPVRSFISPTPNS